MIRKTLLIIFTIVSAQAFSQSKGKQDFVDGTFSIGRNEGSLAVHYNRLWNLTKKQKLSAGIGARITSYLGANQYYVTAPAELTSGSTGPFVIFKENIVENMDTFLIQSPQITSINISINIHYKITEKISAGFNIDAIGLSLGGKKQGNYINGDTNSGAISSAKPTSFNALLISDNDLGSLNSELFARYQINDKLGLKLGASFLFTEYTTNIKVQTVPKENDRFRKKSLMLGLGISYKLNSL
jgi:hypothetical protein